mgnify:CR=1 FL=1
MRKVSTVVYALCILKTMKVTITPGISLRKKKQKKKIITMDELIVEENNILTLYPMGCFQAHISKCSGNG